MTNSKAEPPGPSNELSEEQRAAALRAGRTPVPPKFIMWAVVTFAVLGLSYRCREVRVLHLLLGKGPVAGAQAPLGHS